MIVALIPLREGSKSIPLKNIKPLNGKPLCYWALKACCEASGIDKVFVSTESAKIKAIVLSLGLDVEVVDRPDALAKDDSSTEDVMLHFAKEKMFDVLCTVQATSPLIRSQDIDSAIRTFQSNRLDSLLTAVRLKRFFWSDGGVPLNYDPVSRPRRQEFAGTLMENGAFYLTSRRILEETKCRLGGKIGTYEMDPDTEIEIDEPDDWTAVEALLERRKFDDR